MTSSLARVQPPKVLKIEQARDFLAACRTVDEAKKLRDAGVAMQVYLRQQKAAKGAQDDAGEIRLRAEIRCGELLARQRAEKTRATGGRPKPLHAEGVITLEKMGISSAAASRWQKLARVPGDVVATFVKDARGKTEGEVTATGLLRAASGTPANFSSDSVEWYLTKKYVDAVREVLGKIDLDPASCAKANQVIRAADYFSKRDDGLRRMWRGRVYVNPPYNETLIWCQKLLAEYDANRVTAAILLVNANTETDWFQPLLSHWVCFTSERIPFWTPGGGVSRPLSGNAFVYLGKEQTKFRDRFLEFGAVVKRA